MANKKNNNLHNPVSNTPLPPKVREMMDETEDLLYIANVLKKRVKAYTKELTHIQQVYTNPMTRQAARAQYNALVKGGKISLDKFISDLESSERAVDRSVKDRISKYVRNAAILKLAKANTTKKLADLIKKLDNTSK